MSALARTKADVSRAMSQGNLAFLGEVEVVNDADMRVLTALLTAQLRRDKKLRVFVVERSEKQMR